MTMKIKRMNMDIGNSISFAMFNGEMNIMEIPTAVVSLSEAKAKGYFSDEVAKSKLKESLMLKVEDQYYLVGEAAVQFLGNDAHIGATVHEKTTSNLSMIMFYALIALYDAEQNMDKEESSSMVMDYFSTMLPIFEVLEAPKFSDKTEEMAARFKGKFEFEVATKGCTKKIQVETKRSECYIEGQVAKFALKYKFDLTESDTAEKFDRHYTINNDMGGGTIDQVRLGKRLDNPKSRNDFKSITEAPFLGMVKKLYEEKLRKYSFKSARDVEQFIVRHYESDSYHVVNSLTGEKTDITTIIDEALREYTHDVMETILRQYPSIQGEVYKYNYYGGVAPILRKYIKEYVVEKYGEEVFEKYHHIEPDNTARFLNLYGLEIISRQATLVGK